MKSSFAKQKRIKSIIMWLGFVSAALLTVGIDWRDMTSWIVMGEAVKDFLCNPARIILFCYTMYSIANNPTNKAGF